MVIYELRGIVILVSLKFVVNIFFFCVVVVNIAFSLLINSLLSKKKRKKKDSTHKKPKYECLQRNGRSFYFVFYFQYFKSVYSQHTPKEVSDKRTQYKEEDIET